MCEKGRSMVEMLGVLAIIGVLSIGAMSGYSQAMFKYKLNKHTSQIGYIIDYIIANQDWLRSASFRLQGILNKMDVVPDDMIKDDSKYVYDVFSSRIKLENHTNEGGGFAIGVEINNNKHAIEICRNFIIMAKERADDVSAVYIQREELDGSYSGMSLYYGNKIKGQSNYLHNLDVIKCADWVIDLGPEGGSRGGEIVAVGTPEQIADCRNSLTGRYLKKVLC